MQAREGCKFGGADASSFGEELSERPTDHRVRVLVRRSDRRVGGAALVQQRSGCLRLPAVRRGVDG